MYNTGRPSNIRLGLRSPNVILSFSYAIGMALSQLYHYYLSIIYTYYYYKLQLYVKKRIYVTVEQINEIVRWSEVNYWW